MRSRGGKCAIFVLASLLNVWTFAMVEPEGGTGCDPSKLVALTDRTSVVARANDPDQVRCESRFALRICLGP